MFKMKTLKNILIDVFGILFIIFIVTGWFQPDGYWSFVGINPYDLSDLIFNYLFELFS